MTSIDRNGITTPAKSQNRPTDELGERAQASRSRCLSQSEESLMSTLGTEPDGTYWYSVDINPLTYTDIPHT